MASVQTKRAICLQLCRLDSMASVPMVLDLDGHMKMKIPDCRAAVVYSPLQKPIRA